MTSVPDSKTPASRRRCPICGKPETPADAPFCSARCADVDLNRWLGGVYAIPSAPDPDDEEGIPGAAPDTPER